jgi:hypothetical protein
MAQSLIDLLQHFKLSLTLRTPKSTYPPLTSYSISPNNDFKNFKIQWKQIQKMKTMATQRILSWWLRTVKIKVGRRSITKVRHKRTPQNFSFYLFLSHLLLGLPISFIFWFLLLRYKNSKPIATKNIVISLITSFSYQLHLIISTSIYLFSQNHNNLNSITCDKSVSLHLQRERSGNKINFLRNATGDFDIAGTSSTSSSSSNTSSSSTENLQPFLPFRHRRHFAFPGTTSQFFLTPWQ